MSKPRVHEYEFDATQERPIPALGITILPLTLALSPSDGARECSTPLLDNSSSRICGSAENSEEPFFCRYVSASTLRAGEGGDGRNMEAEKSGRV
jgi:hypothetical protein